MEQFSWASILTPIMAGEDLGRERAAAAMAEVMSGNSTPAQMGAFIVGLRTKGETASELAGMVDAMMDAAVTVEFSEPVVDVVGTGGDGFGTFNISTTASFIAAGAGVKIAKHGNRAASSPTGSADLLETLGFDLDLTPEATKQLVDQSRFGFFFAPRYHPAMRHVAATRSELGVRTVFNFLGPMCNPAGARMCVGVSDVGLARLMIEVFHERGVDRGFVVCGADGMDEISISAPTRIFRLVDGEVTEAEFTPEDFGVARADVGSVVGGTPEENVTITRSILEGQDGPRRDIALMNAAPAVVLGGKAVGFLDAMAVAREAIDSGAALRALDDSLRLSQQLSDSSS